METANAPRKKTAHKTATKMLPRLARALFFINNITARGDKNRPRQRNLPAAIVKSQKNLDPPGDVLLVRPRALPAGFDFLFPVFNLFAIRIILECDGLDRSHLSRTDAPFGYGGNCRGKIFL